jgi:rSAM/selenodomain-associated transferase 2
VKKEPISVVIPVLNGAACLPACLRAVNTGQAGEVIVVDGGSTDTTVAVARAAGATVLQAPAGRGGQMRAGVAAASGKILLLLHADTILAPNWADAAAALQPGKAGYFRLRLDSPRRAVRVLELFVRLRCRLAALPYGDQGLLIGRDLLAAAGGVPDLALMEDVALARRLGRHRLQALAADAVTSAEKRLLPGAVFCRRAGAGYQKNLWLGQWSCCSPRRRVSAP